MWEAFESPRYLRSKAHRDVLLCSATSAACFGFLHPTLLEGVRARGCRLMIQKKRATLGSHLAAQRGHALANEAYVDFRADKEIVRAAVPAYKQAQATEQLEVIV